MRLLRKAVWISALSSVLALITSSTAVAGVTTPVRASALASPLAACASQDGAQIAATGGRNYLNAEVEPTLGVYGNHLIGQWHEDRWSNGGDHGIGVGVSNGGTSWSNSVMPWDACGPGTPPSLSNYLRNSDPWVSFGPDRTAYAPGLGFNLGFPDSTTAVAVAHASAVVARRQDAPHDPRQR